jgi:hypothetical protein
MKHRFCLLGVVVSLLTSVASAADTVSLAGKWRVALDRDDVGVKERWFGRELASSQQIALPGTLPGAGIGDPVTLETAWADSEAAARGRKIFAVPQYAPYRKPENFKWPFWLQPTTSYIGAAWYQRDIKIPAAWQGRRVVLTLENAHWDTRVWLDDRYIGTLNSLSAPHVYDLGSAVEPGQHRLTIRVDNLRGRAIDVGLHSCSISDHSQGNWNGIVGRIELAATSPVWIDDAQVYPDVSRKSALIKVRIGNHSGQSGSGTLTAGGQSMEVKWDAKGGTGELMVPLGDKAQVWDEFQPALHRLTVKLKGSHADDTREVVFGLREISAKGTQFVVNGRKTFIRSTCESGIFPKTGHPPTDVESWKRVMRICKEYGLNSLRFHCYCPPEAAFAAADELGMYLIIDCSTWPAGGGFTLGDGKPIDQWGFDEADRILKAYGNHPSFVLMLLGCEPDGEHSAAYLDKWVTRYKSQDSRRLISATSGWPNAKASQWYLAAASGFCPRIAWFGNAKDCRINTRPPETATDYGKQIAPYKIPIVSNEIGQWCAYPNFDEIPKYTGYLKAKNFEIFRDLLESRHMGDQARQFLRASGKLQVLCYKEEIESALRTPGMGGFALLQLHDFPGQGTALVGVLDAFFESKGYVTSAEFRRFCNATVPLARMAKRVFTNNETLEADIEVAHFGAMPLENAATQWKLVADDGRVVAEGRLPAQAVSVDNNIKLGKVSIDLKDAPAPARYKLVVNVAGFENDWDVWVYPPNVDKTVPAEITVASAGDDSVTSAINNGGKVLLVIPPARVRSEGGRPVRMAFSSVFWNTHWCGSSPTTLGILCDPKHPAFADFPTDFHSNWQWWYLITQAAPMILDEMPASFRPTVQVMDDWFTARKLGLLFEANVGKAKVVVSSIALDDTNPVARQLRASLLRYMASDAFQPSITLTAGQIHNLWNSP